MHGEVLRWPWTAEDAAAGRPDKVLAVRLGVSRSRLQEWWAAGRVCADGRPLGPKEEPRAGELVEVAPPAPVPDTLAPEDLPLDILHEDADLIVINKAAGMVVHPGAGHRSGTLAAALLHHCAGRLSGIGGVERPGIVHRLDRDTSGVLVVAKTDAAHQSLAGQFKDRTTRKTYQAFVAPPPRTASGAWEGPIARHPRDRQRMAVRAGGRPARTVYRVVCAWRRAALLELDLKTGRTHQIRVHCSHAGHPVVGDPLYGRPQAWWKEAGVARQLLHAWRLEFTHPRTKKPLALEAPLPQDFRDFRRVLETSG